MYICFEHDHPYHLKHKMCNQKDNLKSVDALGNPILTENLDTSLWNDKCDYIDIESCTNLNPNFYNMIVLQLNVRGLLSSQSALTQLLIDLEKKNSRVDIVLLCETFLNKRTAQTVRVPGYTLVSKERTHKKGGGTGILVRNQISYKKRADLDAITNNEVESTHIEIIAKNSKSIIVGSLYKPPDGNNRNFTDMVTDIIEKARTENKEIILGMDHNMDLIKSTNHKPTQLFLDSLIDRDMLPTITRPTRITHSTATLIDNIFVSKKLHADFESAIIIHDMSDHMPLLTLLKQTKVTDRTNLVFKSRNLTEGKLETIRNRLFSVDWIGCLNASTCNKNFEKFQEVVNDIMNEVSPLKDITISYKRKYVEPWMSRGIEISGKKKLELYKRTLKRGCTQEDIVKYKRYRNEYNRLKRAAQIAYYRTKVIDFRYKTRELWKVVNNVIGKTKHRGSIISYISINGIKDYNPTNIADEFARFYSNLGPELAKKIPGGELL